MDVWQKKLVHASIGEIRVSLQILAHDELVFKVCGACYNTWNASLDFGFIWICLNRISYGPHASIVIPRVGTIQPTHAIWNIQTNQIKGFRSVIPFKGVSIEVLA